MGVFSQLLDSDSTRDASVRRTRVATGRVRSERRLREPWQTSQAVRRAANAGRAADRDTSPFTPVRGVTLEVFADIARAVASQHDAGTRGTELAVSCGITANDWLYASRVWNARIANNPAVAHKLSVLYRPHVIDLRDPQAS